MRNRRRLGCRAPERNYSDDCTVRTPHRKEPSVRLRVRSTFAKLTQTCFNIVNMFTENSKEPYSSEATPNRRGRGRPRGRTPQGVAARLSLYNTAIALIAERGYEATTLRDVADRAGVSVGLLYRYFPSKRGDPCAIRRTLRQIRLSGGRNEDWQVARPVHVRTHHEFAGSESSSEHPRRPGSGTDR